MKASLHKEWELSAKGAGYESQLAQKVGTDRQRRGI